MWFSSVLRCYATESLSRRLYLLSIENHPVLCAGAGQPFITLRAFERAAPLSRHLRGRHKRLQTGWEMAAAILFCCSSASGKNKCDGSKSGQSLVTLSRADGDSLRALSGFCGAFPRPRTRGESPVNGLNVANDGDDIFVKRCRDSATVAKSWPLGFSLFSARLVFQLGMHFQKGSGIDGVIS